MVLICQTKDSAPTPPLGTDPESVTVEPKQMELIPHIESFERVEFVIKGSEILFPTAFGEEDITRKRYPLAPVTLLGINPIIIPEVVVDSVPIIIGEPKLPVESESCNVNTLFERKTPVTVKGTPIESLEITEGRMEVMEGAGTEVTVTVNVEVHPFEFV